MPTKGYLITDKSGEMKKSLLTCKKRVLDLRGPKKNRCHFQKPRRFKKKTFEVFLRPQRLEEENHRGLEDRKGYFKFL